MRDKDTYPFAAQFAQGAEILGLSPARVLRRAGLDSSVLDPDHRGITAQAFFDVWCAVEAEAARPDLPLVLGRGMAHAPLAPAVYGMACSPDIETGFARLAVFKPLVAPIRLCAERREDRLVLRWMPSIPGLETPELLALFELVFFLELCRIFTATPIVPLALGAPLSGPADAALRAFFGCDVAPAPAPEMHLAPADARRRMIFANDVQYRQIEAELNRALAERAGAAPVAARVRRALVDLLPSGEATLGAVARRLAVSGRSLQRRLSDEGSSFQQVLDETRAELSLLYLRRDGLSVPEIAYLLAYRDPNSFYRAFQGWTGMTPGQARARGAPARGAPSRGAEGVADGALT